MWLRPRLWAPVFQTISKRTSRMGLSDFDTLFLNLQQKFDSFVAATRTLEVTRCVIWCNETC